MPWRVALECGAPARTVVALALAGHEHPCLEIPGDAFGRLALASCVESGMAADLVGELLEAWPQAAAELDAGGATALHLVQSGPQCAPTVRLLLRAHPRAAWTADADGCLPLHRLLLRRGVAAAALAALMAAHPAAAHVPYPFAVSIEELELTLEQPCLPRHVANAIGMDAYVLRLFRAAAASAGRSAKDFQSAVEATTTRLDRLAEPQHKHESENREFLLGHEELGEKGISMPLAARSDSLGNMALSAEVGTAPAAFVTANRASIGRSSTLLK